MTGVGRISTSTSTRKLARVNDTASCDSCGRDDRLETVRRLYVVPESWDTPGSVTEADGTEAWCFTCRSMYPHVAVEEGEAS